MPSTALSSGRPVTPSLATVARRFWWPVYGAIRDRGTSPESAAALTGRVLVRLTNGSPFLRHDDHDGRLRLLLFAELAAVTAQTGPVTATGLPPMVDPAVAEARGDYGPGVSEVERFRRRWATVVLEEALAGLRAQAGSTGGAARLSQLVPFLARHVPDWHDTDIAEAVDSAEVDNLRDEFRAQVRRVVGETVTTPMGLESELLALFE